MPRIDGKTGGKSTYKQKTSRKKVSSQFTGTVHDVLILDSSSSMSSRNKYGVAVEGIKEDYFAFKQLQEDNPEIDYTYSIIEFSYPHRIHTHISMSEDPTLPDFSMFGGMTALNQSVGETIENIRKMKRSKDKALIKIFTDGGENASRGKYKSNVQLKKLIASVEEEGFTVTFIGTEKDTETAIRSYGLSASNTMTHQNTADTVRSSFSAMTSSRTRYSKRLKKGEAVKDNFYQKTT